MEPAQDLFYPLQALLLDLHPPIGRNRTVSLVTCAFDNGSTRNCASETSEGNCDSARLLFQSILNGPDVHDVRKNKYGLLGVFHELANLLLCDEHATYCKSLRSQWEREFGYERAEALSFLKQYYEAKDKEEEADAAPSDSFSPAGFRMLYPDITEQEVALKVTEKLNEPLGSQGKLTGCVYIISFEAEGFEGMLKIGQSKKDPRRSRFNKHARCIGPVEVIKIRFVTCAHRVEQLLHAEFSHVHHEFKCQNCPTRHKEIFKIDKETVLKSLEKWCNFFDEFAPYRSDGKLGALPEDGPKLPDPILRHALRQPRSAKSSRFNTPSSMTEEKESSRKKTSTRTARVGTPTGTPLETPTKRFQHNSSSLTPPSIPGPKTPTITTTALPDSDDEYMTSQESVTDPDDSGSDVGWLAATIRRLIFT